MNKLYVFIMWLNIQLEFLKNVLSVTFTQELNCLLYIHTLDEPLTYKIKRVALKMSVLKT